MFQQTDMSDFDESIKAKISYEEYTWLLFNMASKVFSIIGIGFIISSLSSGFFYEDDFMLRVYIISTSMIFFGMSIICFFKQYSLESKLKRL